MLKQIVKISALFVGAAGMSPASSYAQAPLPHFWGTSPTSNAPLFNSDTTIYKIQIRSAFSDLLSQNRSPENKANRLDVPAEVILPDGIVISSAKISLRGNTSLRMEECPFAKMALKFQEVQLGNLFHGLKSVGIGTHCGDLKEPSAKYGRIRDQISPIREAQVYKTLNLLGAPTLKSRLVVIEYIDQSSTSKPEFFPQGPVMEKHALFIERENDAAKRYFGGQIFQEDGHIIAGQIPFPNARDASISAELLALAVLSETLVENHDWHIRMHGTDDAKYPNTMPLWNISFGRSGKFEPMLFIYDWDISGWVRAVRFRTKDRFGKAEDRLKEYGLLSKDQLDTVKELFFARKDLIYREVFKKYQKEFPNDKKGYRNMKASFEDFYDWLEQL